MQVQNHYLVEKAVAERLKNATRDGGKYVFLTPHAFSGLLDISKYFSNSPQAFHMKEWTYRELGILLKTLDFSGFYGIWKAKQVRIRMPFLYFHVCEALLSRLPPKMRRRLAPYFVPSILMVAISQGVVKYISTNGEKLKLNWHFVRPGEFMTMLDFLPKLIIIKHMSVDRASFFNLIQTS